MLKIFFAFFFLSKILQFLITPLIWVIALLVYSLVSKKTERKRKAFITSLVLLYFFSNQFIFNQIMSAWEIPATPYEHLETYDAGIVLGGMVSYDNQLDRLQFDKGADRLWQAIELYKRGTIKKIIFTGGSGSISFPEHKEALFIERYLKTLQIPDSAIILEKESRNTHENAEFTKPILEKNGLLQPGKKLLLITSAFHMRRSLGCFSKAGITAAPYSTDRYGGIHPIEIDYLLIPNVDALDHWTLLTHELAGYLTYKISGYL